VTVTRLACIALAAAAIALSGGGAARAQVCAPLAYPGDVATRDAIAQWMSSSAGAATLPRELPVMGALVESGLTNLKLADADSVGFFQMRVSIWNTGQYAGFPEHPELQLQWFVDQATAIRKLRLAAGGPDPALAETGWGAWIADVLRPAEQFRGRYQLRLAEARGLVGAACVEPSGGPPSPPGLTAPPPPPLPAADTVAPVVDVAARRRQRALRRRAIVLDVGCPAEGCAALATATLRLTGRRRAPRIVSEPGLIAAGTRTTLRLALDAQTRARVRKALRSRSSVAAAVGVLVVDTAGNRTVRRRTVRISG
jgi:hypothetical protein